MRVITGIARGKRLRTLPGERVRPTTERVKEALFSIIQFELGGRRALDLFAGSGQLGIEAISRGAESVVFVDRDKRALTVARSNAENCGFAELSSFVQTDSLSFLRSTLDKFSLVFLDPPYLKAAFNSQLSLLEETLSLLPRVLEEEAVVCAESPANQALPTVLGKLSAKEYRHGKTKLSVYRA
ncbi:MAG: 16S rRNA (guanine(966)-N(2))-methyltransferase RsmD [Oscillospiraceae bacterium]|jgi:16S rRNA (guanine(966)-N(2))-methyltransferase RsmD|nr:16S rRNA (guanine(966)-N(2))-methyltransferase RsmD [Oscillospiraceae bacterium]